jgi:diacylglycerol kinase family enzyme
MAEWLVILNPNAGGGQAEKDWPQIADELKKQGFHYDLIKTRFRLDAIQLVDQSIRKGFRKIIAIGGDGTLHEIANGVMQQQHVKPNEIAWRFSVGTGTTGSRRTRYRPITKRQLPKLKMGGRSFRMLGKLPT